MIIAKLGDLTKVTSVDYICNAANGIGPMGRGIAGAIKRAGGSDIERDAYRVCGIEDPQVGDIYTTIAGTLPYKNIIHMVTMKTPGGPTSLQVVEKCLKNLVVYCKEHNINKIGLPALSTGVGGLDKRTVAEVFKKVLSPVENIEFLVIDIDNKFIRHFE